MKHNGFRWRRSFANHQDLKKDFSASFSTYTLEHKKPVPGEAPAKVVSPLRKGRPFVAWRHRARRRRRRCSKANFLAGFLSGGAGCKPTCCACCRSAPSTNPGGHDASGDGEAVDCGDELASILGIDRSTLDDARKDQAVRDFAVSGAASPPIQGRARRNASTSSAIAIGLDT